MKYNQENAMDYFEKYGEQIEDFLAVCRKLGESLFVTSHGGNLAWKLEENLILITPTKLNKGEITRKDLVFIDMDGRKVEGVQKPTGETPIYLGFFRAPLHNCFCNYRGEKLAYVSNTSRNGD
jgi:ribulose-5-phosphate 4-epimerase/fuculose-1-phosphate aldolase